MILFKKDWAKYPNAVVHLETKNKSFLRYAGLVKSMGYANHAFVLQLHNPLLKNVDPHSPDLTTEEKLMISEELSVNFFYYVREVARIELPGSPVPTHFLANRGNMATYWLFFNYITVFLEQIRQTGKSATINQLIKGVKNYMASNTAMTMITKDSKLRGDNTRDLQKIEGYLPPYLKRVTKNDMDSIDGITVKALDNKLSIKLAQKSLEAAKNLNRGSTDTMVLVDELPYLYNIDTSLPVALSAGSRAIRAAKNLGQPAGIIFYTSAGYMDTQSGAYGHGIYKNGAKWSEALFDLEDREELEEYVKKHSSGKFDLIVVEMNHLMLGYDNQWLRDTIKLVGANKIQAMVELMNIWVKGGTDTLLHDNLKEKLYKQIKFDSPTVIESQGFGLVWHESKESVKNKTTIVSIDMSELLGNDSSTVLITDILNGATCARGHFGKANINEFGLFVFNLLISLPSSTLMIERNSMGIAILDQLAVLFSSHNKNIFKRVFNTVVDDGLYKSVIKTDSDAALAYTNYKEKFGFRTSSGGAHSRDSLYGRVVEIAELCVNHICDKVLIEELCSIEIRKGRIDHKLGKHDDMVIAYMLAHWLLRNGRNLSMYGINAGAILTGVVRTASKIKEDDLREKLKAKEKMASEVDRILTDIVKYHDNFVKVFQLKAKLKLLKRRMGENMSKSLNIEARLNEILEEKK